MKCVKIFFNFCFCLIIKILHWREIIKHWNNIWLFVIKYANVDTLLFLLRLEAFCLNIFLCFIVYSFYSIAIKIPRFVVKATNIVFKTFSTLEHTNPQLECTCRHPSWLRGFHDLRWGQGYAFKIQGQTWKVRL